MPRKAGPILDDMLTAIDAVLAATAGKSYAQFRKDWLLRHGVQRGIEIVSEASRHLPAALLARHPEIEWAQIKGIGSVLRHEYHRVSDEIIWGAVKKKLPALKKAIESMMAASRQAG